MTRRTHYRTCNLCEAMCGVAIDLDGDRILSVRGDKADPLSQGHICPKAVALQDVYEDPDRLRQPVRRTAAGWQPMDWDEALDEVATRLQAVQQQHGRDAVGIYLGNPNVHNVGSLLYGPPLVRALRTRNRFSATSADQLPHHYVARFMYGHQLLIPVPDIDRTEFMLILGANPLASNGSLMSAPGVKRRLQALQSRGGRLVVVDPRRTETARLADAHHFIQPGSDALLLLAMLHTIHEENLAELGRLADFTDGLKQLWLLTSSYSPESVTKATGIAAAKIKHLARQFASAGSAVCYGRIGTSTQAFGGLATWLINVLNIVTGNLDRSGGAMFTRPAFDVVGITTQWGATGRYGRWQSRVRGRPEFGGELPVAVMAEEILTPGPGQIKAMITAAGNPVLSTPNGTQLDKALAGLEFMASIDIYVNETTRHAHIILPPTTGLETEHYDLAFHALAVRNTAKYSEALFPPSAGARHDWEILRDLRRRLEGGMRARLDIFQRFTPAKIIDLALRTGPYGMWGGGAKPGGPRLTLPRLKRAVHGIDLGPLQPCLPGRLCTPQRRIDLVPEPLAQDLDRLRQHMENSASGNGRLWLIGRRQLRSNNSWMHNSARLVKGNDRCTLLIHPADAAARGIGPGQLVMVASRVGQTQLAAEISDEMMPGVVSIPHGWGHHRPGIHLQVAQRHAGVSINDLTDEFQIDELTGNAAFSRVAVEVSAVDS
jgi:anaerobic selenocysteine-containing dehydrogenase